MEFRILGALEVWDGKRPVPLAGRLHPKILAGLLLNAGRTVSVAWLAELLWDDTPPATARRQVQNAVAALRRQLPRHGDLIERGVHGYRLNLGAAVLDLSEFDAAIQAARRATPDGDAALDAYENALALWRGSALDGLTGRVLEAAALRLNDTYVSTYEEYAGAALNGGEAERVLDKLVELAAIHPLRQRLAARLMHALYQTRRGPEALQLFETVRRRLSDELGTGPGPELRDLHVRILQQDPTLAPEPHDDIDLAAPPSALVPAQLPADVSTFTGREDQVAALDRLRASGATAGVVSTIAGIGGVGKTALAVHWGHGARERFPDGQLYINLRGFDEREPLTAYEAVSRLLRSLGIASESIPSDLDEASSLFRVLLADKRMLVVLDNASTPEQVLPLLPDSPGNLALVTSRSRLSSLIATHDAHPVNLGTLDPHESLDLLTNLVGPAAVEDIDNARKLCGLCGHLPLALRVAAANLATNPDVTLAEYATELDSGSRLAKFKIGDDPSANLTTVFHSSYRVLSLNTRQIFLHFGLIPGEDFTVSLAASLVSMDWNVVEVALRRLETAHLIEQHQPGRFRLHDLVRLFVRELASRELAEPQQEAAVDRLIEWYGDRSNPRLPEFDNILAACESLQRHPHLWKLVNALGAIANTGGDFQRARHFADIALSAAESNKDVEGQVYSLDALASFSRAAGDHEKSVDFRRAAANLLPHIDNDELEGKISNNLGNSLQGQGNLRESVYHLNHAVKVAHASNLDQLLIVSLGNLGGVLCSMGRFDEAFVATSRALKLVERRDDLAYIRALFTITRGLVFKDVGRYGDALLCGDTALEIADGLGATKVTVLALQLKGVVSHKATKLQQAVEYLDRAAVVAQTDPNIVVQIGTLHYQADVYLDLGDVERAFACLDTATGLARYWHSNSEARAQSECIRGRAFLASGEVGKAIEHGSKAAEIYRTLHPSPLLLGQSLVALGHAHNAQDNKDEALVCWNEALEIFTALKVPDAVSLREELQSEPMPSPPT